MANTDLLQFKEVKGAQRMKKPVRVIQFWPTPADIEADLAPWGKPQKTRRKLENATEYATGRRGLLAAALAMGVAR